jgi:putative ABC transport system substrate-binding protein
MKRRHFITLLGGAAAAWPVAASAQQPDRVRRVGALMNIEGDPNARTFQQSLEKLGWIAGRNLLIEFRWGAGDIERTRSAALELLRLEPDVILVNPVQGLALLQKAAEDTNRLRGGH